MNPRIILVWFLTMLFAYESSAEPNIEVIDAYNLLTMGNGFIPFEQMTPSRRQQFALSDQCTVVSGPTPKFGFFGVSVDKVTSSIDLHKVDWSTVRYNNNPSIKEDSIEVIAECLGSCKSFEDADGKNWTTKLIAAGKQQSKKGSGEIMEKIFDKGHFYSLLISKRAVLEDAIELLSNACPLNTAS